MTLIPSDVAEPIAGLAALWALYRLRPAKPPTGKDVMKKSTILLVTLFTVLATTGLAYAGCFTTYNFSPTTVSSSDKPRLVLQCFAMRMGGTGWSISGDGRSTTKAGGSTYSTTTPQCDSSGLCVISVTEVGIGSNAVRAEYYTSGSATIQMSLTHFNENGTCQLYLSNIPNPTWGQVLSGSVKVKYCR